MSTIQRRRAMKPTPNMRKALKQLAAAEGPIAVPCGQPTRQRLAKYGFAKYAEPLTTDEALHYVLSPWDRPMVITAAGRAAVGLPSFTDNTPKTPNPHGNDDAK